MSIDPTLRRSALPSPHVNGKAPMRDDALLNAIARSTAAEIVNRHAHDRQALASAIERLTRLALEGHVQLFETQHSRPSVPHAPDMHRVTSLTAQRPSFSNHTSRAPRYSSAPFCEQQARTALTVWTGAWIDKVDPKSPMVEIDAAGNGLLCLPHAVGVATLPMTILGVTSEYLEFRVERPEPDAPDTPGALRCPAEDYVLHRIGRSAGLAKAVYRHLAILYRGGGQ
jgi:hypothetical protein